MSPSNTEQDTTISQPLTNGVGHHEETPELKQALLKQLEYYFSKENLEKDDYLKSQMTADLFVPVQVIAGFTKVKLLTTDVSLIVEVLRSSKEVVVSENGESVRPNIKVQRSTLILRDIPADVPVQEVEEIFKHEGCAPVKSLKSDVGNTWFVTFETENEALETLFVIRTKTFKGQPVQARVKSENPLKTLFSSAPPPPGPVSVPGYSGEQQYYSNPYYQYYDSNGQAGKNPRSGAPAFNSAPRGTRNNQGGRGPSSREYRDDREYRDNHHHRDSRTRTEQRGSEARGTESHSETKLEGSHKTSDKDLGKSKEEHKPTSRPPRKVTNPTGSASNKTSGHPRGESSSGAASKTKPKVVLGPESFPPLPGVSEAKQEISFALNYSAVANAVADKPVQNDRLNARKSAQAAEPAAEKKQDSEEAEGKKASASRPPRGGQERSRSQHGPRSAAPRGEKPASRPSEPKEKPSKDNAVEGEQPKEAVEGNQEATPSEQGEGNKDADPTKGKSYAEILRMKAAMREQAKPAANGAPSSAAESSPSSSGTSAQPKAEKAQSSGGRHPSGGRNPAAQGGSSRQRPSNSSGSGNPRPRNAPSHPSNSRHRTRSQSSEEPHNAKTKETEPAAAVALEAAPAKDVPQADASAKVPSGEVSTQTNNGSESAATATAGSASSNESPVNQAPEATEPSKPAEVGEVAAH